MKTFTIFTPTFNRAYILTNLYNSLKNQTEKDFIWLIVDDGSSDNTKSLVQEFQSENQIEIRYIFQENKGKHFAVNNGIRNTETSFFCVIDSDDYLAENAVEEMKMLAHKASTNSNVAGFTFIRFAENTLFDKEKYGKKEWISNDKIVYDWEFPGEMIFCIKTDIQKKYLFPEFPSEKFCAESLVLRRIERRFGILVTDKVLAFGDYLEDGLMSNYYQLLLKSPKSALLNIEERLRFDKTSSQERINLAKTYWDIASKTNQGLRKRLFGISPFLILKMLINKRK